MKFISEQFIFESWERLIQVSESRRAPFNKFFGFLELLKHTNLSAGQNVADNIQYHLVGGQLSNSLQSLYFFGDSPRHFTSNDVMYVIFPRRWEENVFQIFLKSAQISPVDAAAICMQGEGFPETFTTEEVVRQFLDSYHLGATKSLFFDNSELELEFTTTPPDRQRLFNLLKGLMAQSDNTKFTIGFERNLITANPGELARGPFTQTLYSGQENLKCLLLANFDLSNRYNISATTSILPSIPNISAGKFLPRNKLIYGAPGTGKSYELRRQAKEVGFLDENIVRVTFYPSYSYQQFVGTYKPTPIYKSFVEESISLYKTDRVTKLENNFNMEPLIDYSFVPGPFVVQLINALKNPDINYLLVVEEINRASVSSVFGDTFQLLDRNSAGESEYDISFNADVQAFMYGEGVTSSKIRLPSNFFIWATMNSADQGVSPLDTAFKRRWTFEYLPLNSQEAFVADQNIVFQNRQYKWNLFRTVLNDKLKSLGVHEDKLIGPFFITEAESLDPEAIKNKLLLYLRDDVVRHNPQMLFIHRTFSDIISAYDNGDEIFKDVSFETLITVEHEA